MRKAQGFISSSLHRSIDNPDALPYLQQALAIARFEPGMYEVAETFLPLVDKPE